MIDKEFEKKYFLSENEYYECIEKIPKTINTESFMQINYYYDTENFDIYNSGETMRVRQKDGNVSLEYKYDKTISNGTSKCTERFECINDFPSHIIFNQFKLHNIGCLTTLRTSYRLGNFVISIDKNWYLGIVDFELEVESNITDKIPENLWGYTFNANALGKYSRFIRKLKGLNYIYEI